MGRLDAHVRPVLGLVWSSGYSQSDTRATDPRGCGYTQARAGKKGGADAQGRDPRQYGYCRVAQEQPSSSAGKQPAAFTPTWKAAKGRLDPHARPFSGLAWWSRYSQSDPRAGDARGRG